MKNGRAYFSPPRTPEDAEQIALFEWLAITRWRGQPLTRWYYHVANGGTRHVLEAMKLKRMGLKAGVPDIVGVIAASGYHGHYVELKAQGGSVRPEQRAWHELLREEGYRVDVAFGWYEGSKAIERYLGKSSPVQERGGQT